MAHSVRDKPVDKALIDSMKQHGTWLVATLSREDALFAYVKTPAFASDPFFTRGVTPAVLKTITSPEFQKKAASDPNIRQYPRTLDVGGKKISRPWRMRGCDTEWAHTGVPGRFQGYFEHVELELMVDSGLTPMQAIVAATRSGAEFLKAKDLGTLEPSKWADLIVLGQNPLANIRNTRTIEAVYIAGNKVH